MKASFNRQYIVPNSIILIFHLLGVFLAFSSFNKLTKSKLFLENLIYNWKAKPYTSFKLSSEECSSFHNKPFEHLKIDRYYMKCNSMVINNENSSSYIRNSSMPLYYKELYESDYLVDTLNFSICGEKIEGFDYMDYLNATYNSDYSSKCKKTCGSVDSLNNVLCVRENETCPLNSFKFIKKDKVRSNSNYTLSEGLIDITDNYYLHIFSEGGKDDSANKIILALDVIEDNSNVTDSCERLSKIESGNSLKSKRKNYINYNRRDSTSFLRPNTNASEGYTHINDDLIDNVNSISYIGWKKECYNNPAKSPEKVELYINEYNTVYNNSDGIVFRFSIFTTIVIFVLFIYSPIKMMTDTLPYFYVVAINTIFMMVSVSKIMNNISISWKILYGNAHESYPIEQCSDDYTNFKLAELKDSLSSVLYYDTFLFFSQFFNWTIPLYVLVVLYIKKDDEEEEKDFKDQ